MHPRSRKHPSAASPHFAGPTQTTPFTHVTLQTPPHKLQMSQRAPTTAPVYSPSNTGGTCRDRARLFLAARSNAPHPRRRRFTRARARTLPAPCGRACLVPSKTTLPPPLLPQAHVVDLHVGLEKPQKGAAAARRAPNACPDPRACPQTQRVGLRQGRRHLHPVPVEQTVHGVFRPPAQLLQTRARGPGA